MSLFWRATQKKTAEVAAEKNLVNYGRRRDEKNGIKFNYANIFLFAEDNFFEEDFVFMDF